MFYGNKKKYIQTKESNVVFVFQIIKLTIFKLVAQKHTKNLVPSGGPLRKGKDLTGDGGPDGGPKRNSEESIKG